MIKPWSKFVQSHCQGKDGKKGAHGDGHEKGAALGTGVVEVGIVAGRQPFRLWNLLSSHFD